MRVLAAALLLLLLLCAHSAYASHLHGRRQSLVSCSAVGSTVLVVDGFDGEARGVGTFTTELHPNSQLVPVPRCIAIGRAYGSTYMLYERDGCKLLGAVDLETFVVTKVAELPPHTEALAGDHFGRLWGVVGTGDDLGFEQPTAELVEVFVTGDVFPVCTLSDKFYGNHGLSSIHGFLVHSAEQFPSTGVLQLLRPARRQPWEAVPPCASVTVDVQLDTDAELCSLAVGATKQDAVFFHDSCGAFYIGDTGADAGSDFGSDSDAGSDFGSDSDAGSDFGSDSDAGSDVGSDSDAGSDFGSDSDAGSYFGSDSDAGSDLGSDSDAGSDLGSDSGLGPGGHYDYYDFRPLPVAPTVRLEWVPSLSGGAVSLIGLARLPLLPAPECGDVTAAVWHEGLQSAITSVPCADCTPAIVLDGVQFYYPPFAEDAYTLREECVGLNCNAGRPPMYL